MAVWRQTHLLSFPITFGPLAMDYQVEPAILLAWRRCMSSRSLACRDTVVAGDTFEAALRGRRGCLLLLRKPAGGCRAGFSFRCTAD